MFILINLNKKRPFAMNIKYYRSRLRLVAV